MFRIQHGSVSRANAADPILHRLRRISPRALAGYALSYRQSTRIAQGIDGRALADLRSRYGDADPAPGYSKYLDLQYWIHVKLQRARLLKLHRKPARRVLDLGTGTGYFPYIAGLLGNQAVGVDIGDVPFYDEMIALLGVDRRLWTIHAFEHLPPFSRFDLITAFQICFDQPETGRWRVPEWEFFWRDVADHLLLPGGQLLLEFNGLPSPEVADFFAGQGARIENSIISIALRH